MPYVKYKQADMKTMREMASLVNIRYWTFWSLVRDRGLIDEPDCKVGRMWYYDAAGVKRVIKQVAELREKGVL